MDANTSISAPCRKCGTVAPLKATPGGFLCEACAPLAPPGVSIGHVLMPQHDLLIKLARLADFASRVVAGMATRSDHPQLERDVAAMIHWSEQPEVVAWLEAMRGRGYL